MDENTAIEQKIEDTIIEEIRFDSIEDAIKAVEEIPGPKVIHCDLDGNTLPSSEQILRLPILRTIRSAVNSLGIHRSSTKEWKKNITQLHDMGATFVTNRGLYGPMDEIWGTSRLLEELRTLRPDIKVVTGLDRQTPYFISQPWSVTQNYALVDKALENLDTSSDVHVVLMSDEIIDLREVYGALRNIYYDFQPYIASVPVIGDILSKIRDEGVKIAYSLASSPVVQKIIPREAKYIDDIKKHIMNNGINEDRIKLHLVRLNTSHKLINTVMEMRQVIEDKLATKNPLKSLKRRLQTESLEA